MLDGQFDFPLRAKLVSAAVMRQGSMQDLASFMDTNDYYYGTNAVMSTFIGNHDLPRIIHLAQDTPLWGDQGSDGKDKNWSNQPGLVSTLSAYERVANAFAILLTNRGAPLIYYGDEYGLPGAGDPDNRRDMQWDGYSDNQQFLHDRIATLNDIRSKHPSLRRGTRTTISVDSDSWVYKRSTSDDVVYIAVNRSDNAKQVSGLPNGNLSELVTGSTVSGGSVSVPARQTRIFVTN
jgi:glycosidase